MDSSSSLLPVNSLHSCTSPERQGRGSPERQRKRPRTPPMAFQASPIPEGTPSSSTPVELGSTSQGTPPAIPSKRIHEAWTDATEAQLFEWLELPGNYAKWKCAGIRNPSGSMKTSGLTKKAVTGIISNYLESLNTKKSTDQIMSKIRYLEKRFKEAEDFLRNTGEGLTSNDEKMGISKIRDKVLSICPLYFQVNPSCPNLWL